MNATFGFSFPRELLREMDIAIEEEKARSAERVTRSSFVRLAVRQLLASRKTRGAAEGARHV
ncbi:TPA: hypothetical protein VMX41_001792 [Streptococcus pyogenes]|nr:hypothetical protein [Streptococcus pyogenes]